MSRSLFVASGILFFVFIVFFCSSFGFILDRPISGLYFFVSLIFIVGYCLGVFQGWKTRIIYFGLLASVILFAFGASFAGYDSSGDGRWYHQIGMIYLKNGWNPIYQLMSDLPQLQQFYIAPIWVEHYSKFFEIVGANFYLWSGDIESSKALNILLAIASSLYAYNVFSLFSRRFSGVLAFLLGFSPVVMAQIYTLYIDGALSSLILVVICAIVALEMRWRRIDLVILVISFVMLSSIKLTGIAYSGVIGIGYLIYLYFWNRKRTFSIFMCGVVSFLLVVVCNINPYMTNLSQGKHIFYPLMGKGKVDIITPHMEKNFAHYNRGKQLFISVFGKTQNIPMGSMIDTKPELKIPFTFAKDEQYVNIPDMRIGGFGFLFGGIVIIGFMCIFLSFKTLQIQEKRIVVLLSCLIIVSVLINPALWWARYVPQLWFLPLIFIFFSSVRLLQWLGWIVCFTNICLVFVICFGRSLVFALNTQIFLNYLIDHPIKAYFPANESRSFIEKMMKKGIDFEMVESKDAPYLIEWFGFYTNIKEDQIPVCRIEKNKIKQEGMSYMIGVFNRCFI